MPEDAAPTRRYGIAFGSNLGDRLANLREAKSMLVERSGATGEVLVSAVYESSPIDCAPGSPAFYNAVMEIASPLAPDAMLALCLDIENSLGRPSRRPKNAPRPVDLDLLYAGDLVLETPTLTVPHPRLGERRFVLEPLAQIRPHLVLPDGGETVARLLGQLDSPEPPLRLVTDVW